MPKIINTKTNEERTISEGEPIRNVCGELGVPFSCDSGVCGTCMIDVLEGEENLSELTEEERDLGRDKKHRLSCQCRIKNGDVKFRV